MATAMTKFLNMIKDEKVNNWNRYFFERMEADSVIIAKGNIWEGREAIY